MADDDEIVGIANEAKATFVELPVEMIEDDVSEQGGENAPLRGADIGRLENTELHHARPEKFGDKTEDVAVGDIGSNGLQDDLVREVIEEGFDVSVEDDDETKPVKLKDPFDSRVAVTIGPEAKGRVMEPRFEDGRQETANHLLSDPIANRRNAEGAKLLIVLWNEDPAKGPGLEGARLKVLKQGLEIIGEVSFEHLDANLVDARGASVAFDGFERVKEQQRSDSAS